MCSFCPFECQESPGWQRDQNIILSASISLITKVVGQTYIKIPVNIKISILSNEKKFRQNLFQLLKPLLYPE